MTLPKLGSKQLSDQRDETTLEIAIARKVCDIAASVCIPAWLGLDVSQIEVIKWCTQNKKYRMGE